MTETPARHILVAGVGNIFLGDDAFGSELARRLLARPQPPGVEVVDFGIRGLDLTYALLDGCDAAILLDATPRRTHPPGTLYVIEPEPAPLSPGAHAELNPFLDAHSLDPLRVLQTVTTLGGPCGRVLLVGCEPTPADPASADSDDFPADMSPPVRAALDPALSLVESLIHRLLHGGAITSLTATPEAESPPLAAPYLPTIAACPTFAQPGAGPVSLPSSSLGVGSSEPMLSKEPHK